MSTLGGQSLPTLRLTLRCSTIAGLVRLDALDPDSLAAVATVSLENGTFLPAAGFELSTSGRATISFPDARTLRIAVPPRSRRLLRGDTLAAFSASITTLNQLAVHLDDPSIALVGELTHTKGLSELAVQLVAHDDACVLTPAMATRPFALPIPRPAPSLPPTLPPATSVRPLTRRPIPRPSLLPLRRRS